jgi:hypothetical protein
MMQGLVRPDLGNIANEALLLFRFVENLGLAQSGAVKHIRAYQVLAVLRFSNIQSASFIYRGPGNPTKTL